MAKNKQKFTRQQVEYKLNEKTDTLVELEERTDLQALINSHHDETLFYNLERYFSEHVTVTVDTSDEFIDEDIDLGGTKADKMLNALERVNALRVKYEIPDAYTDREVLQYLRNKASAESNVDSSEGGEVNETQTQTDAQSE